MKRRLYLFLEFIFYFLSVEMFVLYNLRVFIEKLHISCNFGKTDEPTDVTKLIVVFRNFANAPEKS